LPVFRKPLPKRDELFGVIAVTHAPMATPANIGVRQVFDESNLTEKFMMLTTAFNSRGAEFVPDEQDELQNLSSVLARLYRSQLITVEPETVLQVAKVINGGFQKAQPLSFVPEADGVERFHGCSLQLGWYA
jgi:hypothetical protein